MKSLEKGDSHYISRKKKRQLSYVLICLITAVIIFIVGYYLNKKSNANIFTILAVLMVLPGAKFFTTLAVLFPYQDAPEEDRQMLMKIRPGEGELLSSLVFTSPEKVMNLDFLWIGDGHVYGCMSSRGDVDKQAKQLVFIQEYLSKGVKNYSDHYHVQIYKQADGMAKAMKSAQPRECTEKERETVKNYLMSLIV